MRPADPNSNVPAAVRRAIAKLGIRATEISTLPEPGMASARTFLVRGEHGGRLKARIANSPRSAARSTVLSQDLDDARVPAMIGRSGRVTLEPWVDGTPLSSLTAEAVSALVEPAAELLAAIHGFAGSPGEHLPQRRLTERVRQRRLAQLQWSAREGLVSRPQHARIRRLVERELPARAAWGLCHGDLSADNLVLTPDARLVSIDNEKLRREFLDFDLGRTWYRWWLPRADQQRFDQRYREASRRPVDPWALARWRVVACAHGLLLRHLVGADTGPARQRLAEALEQLEQR